jgi:hypothetical protein
LKATIGPQGNEVKVKAILDVADKLMEANQQANNVFELQNAVRSPTNGIENSKDRLRLRTLLQTIYTDGNMQQTRKVSVELCVDPVDSDVLHNNPLNSFIDDCSVLRLQNTFKKIISNLHSPKLPQYQPPISGPFSATEASVAMERASQNTPEDFNSSSDEEELHEQDVDTAMDTNENTALTQPQVERTRSQRSSRLPARFEEFSVEQDHNRKGPISGVRVQEQYDDEFELEGHKPNKTYKRMTKKH